MPTTIRHLARSISQAGRRAILRWPRLTGYRIPVRWIHHIDVEPIASCNLKCPFCQVPGWDRAARTRAMDLELYKRALGQFPCLRSIKIQGMGEPFLNLSLCEMIQYAHQNKIWTSVITNGTLLGTGMREKVLNSGLDDLCFSFDGATKGTYESLRINADFDKVLANIRGICSLKHQQDSRMRISMVCLVSTGTVIEELPKYIDMAGENGVRDVQIKQRLKHWTRPGKGGRYVIDSVSKFTDFPNHEDYLKQATNIARRRGINLSFVEDSLFDSSHPCPWPWQSLYVSAEGKIVPCCTIGIPETWSMGDLKEEKLISLWNAKEYRQLRRRMMRNEVHELCRTCYGLH